MATDAGVFNWPATSGSGVPAFANLAAFPSAITSGNGALAIALDTNILYESNGTTWVVIAGPGAALSVGTFDSGSPSANGAHIDSNALIMQSASGTFPGLVNLVAQTFAGAKTFSTAPILSSLSASLPLQLDGSKNVVSAAINLSGSQATGTLAAARFPALTGDVTTTAGSLATALVATTNATLITLSSLSLPASQLTGLGNLTDAGTDGIVITGGTGVVIGSGTSIAQHVADTTHNGYLSSTDWNTFNGKQAAGNYITALTGDGTAAGPGSVALTLATVNANTGSFGSSTAIPNFTVNGKGLLTAAGTNVVIAPAGTLSGTTLNATVISSSLTSVGTLTTGTWSATTIAIAKGGTGVTSVTTTPTASAFAGWDASKNLSANNLQDGYATVATAAGTTTLTVASTGQQVFTGVTTQTCVLPAVSTLALGTDYIITNLSSGVVTVQSSGANTIQAMAANSQLVVTSIATSGTGTAAWTWTYNPIGPAGLPLTNPMSTGGDIIYGGASGTPTRLANGSANQYLASAGGTSAPAWTSFAAPTIQKFTATGTTTGWLFTISTSSTMAAGDTYTNNSVTYTVLNALTAQTGQVMFCSGAGAPLASGTLTRASGAGTASITFTAAVALATYTTSTSPRSPVYVRVRLVGGGGGGSGGGTTQPGGTAGTTTVFGSNVIIANGGGGGAQAGSTGGGATLGTGPIGIAYSGTNGAGGGANNTALAFSVGGLGGASPFGGNGVVAANSAGGPAQANTGSGGGGGGTTAVSGGDGGGGGGAGGYVEATIASPSATYFYAVGTGGAGGGAGTSGSAGGAGAAGIIIVEEFYQ